jgi:hypothetical protein
MARAPGRCIDCVVNGGLPTTPAGRFTIGFMISDFSGRFQFFVNSETARIPLYAEHVFVKLQSHS